MRAGEVNGADVRGIAVNLPSIIAHTTMDADSINLLKEHLAEFLS